MKADDDAEDDDALKPAAMTKMKSKAVQTPIIAAQRFGAVSDQMEITRKATEKARSRQQAGDCQLVALAELFMPIKLVPKQFEGLVERVRSALERLRAETCDHAALCS